MNTAEFLTLCESNPDEANALVGKTIGCKVSMGWESLHPDTPYCACEDKRHRAPCDGMDGYCSGEPDCICWPVLRDFVGSLDAAWTLEDWVESHADGIFILAKRHGINPAKPHNAAALFCADWLQARGKLTP